MLGAMALPFALGAWLYYLRFGIKRLGGLQRNRLALLLLCLIVLGLPVWTYLSVIEKLAWGKQGGMTFLACVEESLEAALALAVSHLNCIFGQGIKT